MSSRIVKLSPLPSFFPLSPSPFVLPVPPPIRPARDASHRVVPFTARSMYRASRVEVVTAQCRATVPLVVCLSVRRCVLVPCMGAHACD